MALNSAGLHVGGAAEASAFAYVSLHGGDPGASGTANTTTAARQPASWTDSNGTTSLVGTLSFTGGTPGAAATHVGLWSQAVGGTYYGNIPLTGDAAFNAAGQFQVSGLTVVGTSS